MLGLLSTSIEQGGAFSVNDPNTAGYAEGGKRRAAMRKEL